MKPQHMAQLLDAMELQFQAAQQRIKPILEQEAALRQNLAQLKATEAQNRSATQDPSLQASGAEIAWRAWVSKTQRALNIELAQVMARKLPALEHVRHAFGRREAVKEIIRKTEKVRRYRLSKKAQGH